MSVGAGHRISVKYAFVGASTLSHGWLIGALATVTAIVGSVQSNGTSHDSCLSVRPLSWPEARKVDVAPTDLFRKSTSAWAPSRSGSPGVQPGPANSSAPPLTAMVDDFVAALPVDVDVKSRRKSVSVTSQPSSRSSVGAPSAARMLEALMLLETSRLNAVVVSPPEREALIVTVPDTVSGAVPTVSAAVIDTVASTPPTVLVMSAATSNDVRSSQSSPARLSTLPTEAASLNVVLAGGPGA